MFVFNVCALFAALWAGASLSATFQANYNICFAIQNVKFISFERKQTFKERFEGCHPRQKRGFNLYILSQIGRRNYFFILASYLVSAFSCFIKCSNFPIIAARRQISRL